jgi:hypothetical protein
MNVRPSLKGPLIRLAILGVTLFYLGVLYGRSETLKIFEASGCLLGG